MKFNQDSTSEEGVFPYESGHFDRRYLDCWRRQCVVLLQKCGADVDFLFYNSLASTDQIFEDLILSQKPKYAFTTPALDDEGLSLIGWEQLQKEYGAFDAAVDDILEHLKIVPFVIPMGSVFYFPHCPEFKQDHLNHSVVLTRRDESCTWKVIDDDAASVLTYYDYHQRYIDDYFNNNGVRMVRYFKPYKRFEYEEMQVSAVSKCFEHLSSMEDSYRLFDEIELIASNPYESVRIRAKKIHESFSIYSGSRSLFSRFAERVLGDQRSSEILKQASGESMVIKYAMAKAEIIGRFNIGALVARCENLKRLEHQAFSSLREKIGV